MKLQMQADAIRIALLNKCGGIWMDADTIITNGEFLKDLEKYDLVMIGKRNMQHIGFIFASKYSLIIKEWLNEIIARVYKFRKINPKFQNLIKTVNCGYLGNEIVGRLIKLNKNDKFLRIDKNKINAFPEKKFFRKNKLNNGEKFRLFYFQKREPKIILNNTKGIIMLHNSYTTLKYQKMPEFQFLKEDILLSRLFSKLLNNSL